MGIRYYAYAFDADKTDQALADPAHFISADPLADAWGLEPGFSDAITNFEQAVPEDEMLYLDKSWRVLQRLTKSDGPQTPRPSFRMFEGDVTQGPMGHLPWFRGISPDEVRAIDRDLQQVVMPPPDPNADEYETQDHAFIGRHLQRAKMFVKINAELGRGFAYTIW